MIIKNTHVSNILNIINNAKMNWWALKAKFTQNSNKDCQHPEQPNWKLTDRENQVIPDHQSAHSYFTYSFNLNTDNYRFSMNFFNSMFFIMSYLMSFSFIYSQNTQAYQYPQTENKKWQSLTFLALSERKAIESPLSQRNQNRNVENMCQPLRNLLNSLLSPMVYPQYGQIIQNQNQQQAELYCQIWPDQYLLYQNCYFGNQH